MGTNREIYIIEETFRKIINESELPIGVFRLILDKLLREVEVGYQQAVWGEEESYKQSLSESPQEQEEAS